MANVITNLTGTKFVQVVTRPDGNSALAVDANGSTIKQTDYAVIVDDSNNYLLIGKAIPGSDTTAAVWQIKKVDTTNGAIVTWASGNSVFNKVWNDRSGYTYS
jgi:hypothetical protein